MRLAVIPARGGSKRIPRKNIKPFCGKPMIAWSIQAALESRLFDRVVVSTDDAEIADVARQWGAEVPFMRQPELSDDHAGTLPVIAHAARWFIDQGQAPDQVCCLYATAPFVHIADLSAGLALLESGAWAYAFSATTYAAPIHRSFQRTPSGGVEMFFPDRFSTRSQDLPEALHDAGQFYWGRTSAWLDALRIFDRHSAPLMVPRWRVQDIDTVDDWQRAEILAPQILGHGH